jgi:4a-hydroxytetrahydrobiopterin dehydratase
MADVLSSDTLNTWLQNNPSWALAGGVIERTYEFKDFVAAMAFVNRVADMAEEMDHHPDLDIRYNKVRMGLATHSAGGITELDTTLAERADGAAG